MEILRKKKVATRVLILLELVVNRKRSMRQVADGVGITIQAVWEYMRNMEQEGLILMKDKEPKATVKGVDLLHRNLLSLKDFADGAVSRLGIMTSTDAIAWEPISKGDRVTLEMKEGLLVAVKGDAGPSVGIAKNDCVKWDMVTVSDLRGVMDMNKGHILLFEITPARAGGGSKEVNMSDLMEEMSHLLTPEEALCPLFVAADLEAVAIVHRSGIKEPLELPNWKMVKDLLDRGVDIIAIGTPHTMSSYLSHLDRDETTISWRRSNMARGHG